MMRLFTAHVRNRRLILDELTELPEGTRLKLVSADDVVNNGGDLLEDLEASFAAEEAGQLVDLADDGMTTYPITFDAVTDEHVRWYQESIPDSPTTRDVVMAATSDLPVLRWLGRRRIVATINARAKALARRR